MSRIYLSPPHVFGDEAAACRRGLRDATGSRRSARTSTRSSASSGRRRRAPRGGAVVRHGALHLALLLLGVGAGDAVICLVVHLQRLGQPDLLSARHAGLRRLRPHLEDGPGVARRRAESRRSARGSGRRRSSWWTSTASAPTTTRSARLCEQYGVPLVEDAAEALGADLPGPHVRAASGASASSRSTATRSSPRPAAACCVSARAGAGRTARVPRHPGARPGAALRALARRLQLPAEQRAGRHRPRPAASRSTSASRAAGGSSIGTSRDLGGSAGHRVHARGAVRPGHALADVPH